MTVVYGWRLGIGGRPGIPNPALLTPRRHVASLNAGEESTENERRPCLFCGQTERKRGHLYRPVGGG